MITMTDIKLRKATAEDIDNIINMLLLIHKEHYENWPEIYLRPNTSKVVTRKYLKKYIRSKKKQLTVAYLRKSIVGVLMAEVVKSNAPYKSKKLGHIRAIYVIKKQRRKGVATKLINKSIKKFNKYKIYNVRLNVYGYNKKAINLYDKLGFTNVMIQMAILVN